jgi:hypothetical protein
VAPICNDRKAALAVIEGLGDLAVDGVSAARLVRMRGRGAMPFAQLASHTEWLEATARLTALTAAPILTLTEGNA